MKPASIFLRYDSQFNTIFFFVKAAGFTEETRFDLC